MKTLSLQITVLNREVTTNDPQGHYMAFRHNNENNAGDFQLVCVGTPLSIDEYQKIFSHCKIITFQEMLIEKEEFEEYNKFTSITFKLP